MAYTQARSGLVFSGAFLCGLVPEQIGFKIGGTDRTSRVHLDATSVTQELNGKGRASVKVDGFTPACGAELLVTSRQPDWGEFEGTVLRTHAEIEQGTRLVHWTLEAVDYSWLLDRYALVNATYRSMGINAAVARILADFTDGNFVIGEVPMALGDLDATGITFVNARVTQALTALADLAGAYWMVRKHGSYRHVSVRTAFEDGNAVTLVDAERARRVGYGEDISQVRTRVVATGATGPVLFPHPAGMNSLAISVAGPFAVGGGAVQIGISNYTYSSVIIIESSSGSEIVPDGTQVVYLLGLSPVLAADVGTGELVRVWAQADDTAAQTALATLLGGGLSGVAVGLISNEQAAQGATDAAAAQEVARFSGTPTLKSVEYETVEDPFVAPGKGLAVVVTSPVAISGDLFIQRVELRGETQRGTPSQVFLRSVSAAQQAVELEDLLITTLQRSGVAS